LGSGRPIFPLLEVKVTGFLSSLTTPTAPFPLLFPLTHSLAPFTVSVLAIPIHLPHSSLLFPPRTSFSSLTRSLTHSLIHSFTHSLTPFQASPTPNPLFKTRHFNSLQKTPTLQVTNTKPMDNRSSKAKPTQPSSHQGSETLLGPTRRDARSVLHHPYEALSKAHHYQHQHHYRHHHHYLRHERYLHSPASNSSEVWTLPPSPHSSASTSASSLAKTAEWLRWLIHSAAVSSLEGVPNDNTRKLMLLDLPVDGSCTGNIVRTHTVQAIMRLDA
jgi:hypothetical protein